MRLFIFLLTAVISGCAAHRPSNNSMPKFAAVQFSSKMDAAHSFQIRSKLFYILEHEQAFNQPIGIEPDLLSSSHFQLTVVSSCKAAIIAVRRLIDGIDVKPSLKQHLISSFDETVTCRLSSADRK